MNKKPISPKDVAYALSLGRVNIQVLLENQKKLRTFFEKTIPRNLEIYEVTYGLLGEHNEDPEPDLVLDDLNHLANNRQELLAWIEILTGLEKIAEEKPVLPRFRGGRFFNNGLFMVFDNGNFVEAKYERIPYMSQHFYKLVSSNDLHTIDDRPFYKDPCILSKQDFDYLLDHPDFAEIWVKDPSFIGKEVTEEFLGALAKERAKREKATQETA